MKRLIDKELVDAVLDRRPFSKGNTAVTIDGNILSVLLHGNIIATVDSISNVCTIYTEGYKTQTTISRLNALGEIYGFHVFKRRGQLYIQIGMQEPVEWDGDILRI